MQKRRQLPEEEKVRPPCFSEMKQGGRTVVGCADVAEDSPQGLHQRRHQEFREQIAADEQPYKEQGGQQERLGTCLAELVDGGFGTQGGHGHGEHERIDVFNGTVEGDFLHRGGSGERLQEGVEADDADEVEGEPRHGDLALRCRSRGRGAQPRQGQAHDHEHGSQQHDADHLRDGGGAGNAQAVGGVHGVARSGHVGHLVERAAGIDGHLRVVKAGKDARTEHDGVEEHGDGAEDDHRADGNGRLVAFAFHHRLCAQHGGGTTDGTARGGEQGGVAVHLEHFAEEQAQADGATHDDEVRHDGRQSHLGHLAEGEAEAIEHDARAQYLLRAELDAGHPRFGQFVAQTVGIEHSEHDAHDEGTEGKALDKGYLGNVEGGEGEEGNEQDAVERVAPVFFFKHKDGCF